MLAQREHTPTLIRGWRKGFHKPAPPPWEKPCFPARLGKAGSPPLLAHAFCPSSPSSAPVFWSCLCPPTPTPCPASSLLPSSPKSNSAEMEGTWLGCSNPTPQLCLHTPGMTAPWGHLLLVSNNHERSCFGLCTNLCQVLSHTLSLI